MKSEEIRFAINFEYNEHNFSIKEFDLMLQNFAMTYHKEQLLQTDVSSNEVSVTFVKWLTAKDSPYSIMYGGTPELEKDYRLATLENDFTIGEVFEHFKKATN